jgi:hypothetical protein
MSTLHLSDIFITSYNDYCQRYGYTVANHKIARAITSCRTETLGGHLYQCPSCNDQLPLYNSCGNRHCPLCQALARREWVKAREEELLPVPYFHAVFTIPAELNPFALRNKRAFYSILFRSVNETLQQLASTSRYLGASIGFVAVLHTWGQNLMDHPHIHCIIPAGGLSKDGKKWISCKNFFLFPFNVMRVLFRAKVLDYFKQGIRNESITLHGNLKEYYDNGKLEQLLSKLYKKKWVIFAKQPFASPIRVIQYLGNYTHRVAVAESRLLQHDNNKVSFKYKDYADDSKQKIMTFDTVEFIRRFLMHVLPSGFMRIRHYGFLSNGNRKRNRELCEMIFKSIKPKVSNAEQPKKKVSWHERIEKETGVNPLLCKKCGKTILIIIREIFPLPQKGFAGITDP